MEKEIEEMIEFHENQKASGLKAFLKEKVNRKALTIAIGLFVGFELCGQAVILSYTARIFTVIFFNLCSLKV